MSLSMTDLTCSECGFEASRWSSNDLERTLAHADDLRGYVTEGLEPDELMEMFSPNPLDASSDPVQGTHAVMHHLVELARLRREAEDFEPMNGAVVGLYTSGGGVPKLSIPEAVVGVGGVEGDSQGHRVHHGRPWQALCLYSAEVIEALGAEGHPIAAGAVGENLTVEGIDWARLRGGLTIEIGEVRCRVSAPAQPCHQIAGFFVSEDSSRIAHVKHPGWSRWYASVLDGGVIRPGDTVVVSA
jgi:MOSC domain-containing protein YiiM